MPDLTKNGNPIKVSAAEQRLRDREAALQTMRAALLAYKPDTLDQTIRQAKELREIDARLAQVERDRIDTRTRGRIKRENRQPRKYRNPERKTLGDAGLMEYSASVAA